MLAAVTHPFVGETEDTHGIPNILKEVKLRDIDSFGIRAESDFHDQSEKNTAGGSLY